MTFGDPRTARALPALFLATGLTAASAGEMVTVDPAAQYQTLDGWGTSLSWWSVVVGGWSESNRSAIADLVFDPEKGLGLNIARYHIGGEDDPGHDHMRVGGDVQGYWPGPDKAYDWRADTNQRRMLKAAMDRGVNITEAFSCSPPYWMTVSGCSAGAINARHSNLREEHYDTFADYLTEVVRHFRDAWGVTFNTLEPINEAASPFWPAQGFQQGCHFDRAKQNHLLRLVAARLKAKDLVTELAAPDETNVHLTRESFLSYDDDVKQAVAQINTHTYGNRGDRAALRETAAEHGKRLWMSEICFASRPTGLSTNNMHDHHLMKGPLDIAWEITADMRDLRPQAWVFWQPVVNEEYCIRWYFNYGLIHADYTGGTEQWWVTKKYYGYAHYSRFIRPGSRMVGIDVSDAVCFADWDAGTLVIVTYNLEEHPRERTYDLGAFSTLGETVTVHRTSATENLVALPGQAVRDGRFAAKEPGSSITTYVIRDAVYDGLVERTTGAMQEQGTATRSPVMETYEGRREDAPWRSEARERIERIRKADLSIRVEDESGRPVRNARVAVHQQSHAFWFGTEIRGRLVLGDREYLDWSKGTPANAAIYRNKVESLFNVVAFGNDLVWWYYRNARGRETSREVVDTWLQPNGIALRGIPLVWSGKQTWKNPPDLLSRPREELRSWIRGHITDQVEWLDGRAIMWDVLNEPISEPDFIELLGREEAVEWFKLVQRLEPQAKLFCNDYGLLTDRAKLRRFIELVQDLQERGSPIDGVSPQGHFWPGVPLPSMASLKESFDLLASTGLEVYPDQFEVIREDEGLQGDYTRDFYLLAFSHPAVSGITHWGFWAGDIWKPEAAWFREDWSIRPGGEAVVDLIRNQWHTRVEGRTDARGRFTTRGFLGDYGVTISSGALTGTATFNLAESGKDLTVRLGDPATR